MTFEFDVIVYGSTSGAVAAAIQSAKLGRHVALVSPHSHIGRHSNIPVLHIIRKLIEVLGGIQIEGLGASDIDNQAEFQNSGTVGGLALELHRRISSYYGRLERLDEVVQKGIKDPTVWRFESSVAEAVIKKWLSEYSTLHIIYV